MPYILKATILALGIVGLTVTAAPARIRGPVPDDSWISISGTVVTPQADSFKLDFGNGLVTVEVDDFDRTGEGVLLRDGDRVTVFGRIDDDLFEKTKIRGGQRLRRIPERLFPRQQCRRGRHRELGVRHSGQSGRGDHPRHRRQRERGRPRVHGQYRPERRHHRYRKTELQPARQLRVPADRRR